MGNKKERVTRADVAALAGVSETIVSYVINNNRYVAKDKRERVEEAVRVLNYRPNNVARALKGKPSNQILFIADHITNEYFANIVNEMDQYAYDAGYLISLCGNRNTKEFASQVISRQCRDSGCSISKMEDTGVFWKSCSFRNRTISGSQKGDTASAGLWLPEYRFCRQDQ